MQAGLLTKIIELKEPTKVTNAYGEVEENYSLYAKARAKVSFRSESRDNSANEIQYSTVIEVKMRDHLKINEDMIITYSDKNFRILSIDDTIKGEYTIIAEQIND